MFSAIGDFLGFDGEFGYDGINGPDGTGRRLSFAGLGDTIGDVFGAAGDFLGFDGSFGYEGPNGRHLTLGGFGSAIRNLTTSPASTAYEPTLSGFGSNLVGLSNDGGYLATELSAIDLATLDLDFDLGASLGLDEGLDTTGLWTEIADPSWSLINLTDMERSQARPWGGHTIERHVGKTTRYLRERVESFTVTLGPIFGQRFDIGTISASSFTSLSDANAMVNALLDANSERVQAVADGRTLNDMFYVRVGSPTGYEAWRSSVRSPIVIRPTYGVFVYIRHDSRAPLGFVVHTAYPTNRNPMIPRVRVGPAGG